MQRFPIILDTDIGDDIDDALALSLILNSPEFDLRGVTTVFRDAPRRALLARKVLKAWGKDVPVEAGISRPLLEPYDPKALGRQFRYLGDEKSEMPYPHGVEFLMNAVAPAKTVAAGAKAAPLIIAPIGPLTNIAMAIALSPELVSRARLVLMGGFWKADYAEWNIKCDPEAAAMVFNSGIPIDMIGLDVTLRCQLSPDNIAQFAKRDSAPARALSALMKLWHEETHGQITLHDPLAVMTIVSDVVRFEPRRISVALSGADRGKTLVVEGAPNCRVAVDVDVPRAIEEFMRRTLA